MSLWRYELRLFVRQRMALPALVLMFLLSAASVCAGLAEIERQRDVIARSQLLQQADEAAVAKWVSVEGDAGNAAYYTFHSTWDSPSSLAFAAIGQRDVAPYVLRIRALALESQIHESENYNAELALPGRFDWAFVLTYVAPLFLIVLLHDLKSGEREAGRLVVLAVLARSQLALWGRRILVRAGLLFVALVLPFGFAALISGSGAAAAGVLGIAFAYFAFWIAVCLLTAKLDLGSTSNAATLAGFWLILTLVLPGLALLAINTSIPIRQGVELTLAQREAVHAGWDKSKDATMQGFFQRHPEWRDTAPVQSGFHWKWYYAFQHLGDISVAEQVRAYREGLEARDTWTRRIAYLLPPVSVQVALHRVAQTDLAAQLHYQDRVRGFHSQLRRFYYSYIFNDRVFTMEEFGKAPSWEEDYSQ